MSFREQMQGFPIKQMIVISLIRFSEPLAFTSLFPYLYFMIRDFHIAPTEQEISKYSGYLASSFAFFQFLFALHWGKLSNRIGRKPILLFGLLGTSISLILFGFSTNYYFALASRCLAGALNGNIAVLRTVVGEICVERRHQAIGFSTLPLLFNCGSILGPLIGGSRFLTNPKKESPYQSDFGQGDFEDFGQPDIGKVNNDISGIGGSIMGGSGLGDSIVEGIGIGGSIMGGSGLGDSIVEGSGLGGSIREGFGLGDSIMEGMGKNIMGFGSGFLAFRDKHPYALSNIVVSIFLWTSMVIGFLFLEETNDDFKDRRDYGLELGDALISTIFGGEKRVRPWNRVMDPESVPLLNETQAEVVQTNVQTVQSGNGTRSGNGVRSGNGTTSGNGRRSHEYTSSDDSSTATSSIASLKSSSRTKQVDDAGVVGVVEEVSSEMEVSGSGSDSNVDLDSNMEVASNVGLVEEVEVASNVGLVEEVEVEPPVLSAQVITVIASNCIISLHNIAYNEFLPVFLAARFQKENLQFPFKITGGFGLDTSYIGTLFSSTGIMGMLIILFIFPVLDRNLGTLNGYRLSLIFFPVVYACVPLTIFTLHKYNHVFPTWVTPTLLYTMTSMKSLATATGMPQVMVLNHRAAAKKHRAYVNSLTMSMLALSRSVGPIIFGYLMTVGDQHNKAWLSWWSMALLATFGFLQSLTMQDYDD